MTNTFKKNLKDMHILVVDDDAEWRKRLTIFLQNSGYKNIETANDGTAAWNKLNRFEIDIVICNLHLKQMNGLALLKIMMSDEVLCNIPFLMTTNQVEKKDVVDSAKAGVSGFLVKPFSYEKFIDKIDEILNKIDDKQFEIRKLFELAKKYINNEEFEKALEVYNKILTLNEEAEAYYQIGYIKESQGELDAAAKAFRKAIQVNTTFVKAYEALGKTFKKMGNLKESEAFFEKAGDLYLKKEMLEEAESSYMEAHEANSKNINIYNSLGIVYRRKGKYGEAINLYKKALVIEPMDENIYFNLGRAYIESKDINNAKETFEKALSLNPDLKEAEVMLRAINIGFKKEE